MDDRILRIEERQRALEAGQNDLRGRLIALETAVPLQIKALDDGITTARKTLQTLDDQVTALEQAPGRTALSRWGVAVLALVTALIGYAISWLPHPTISK